MLDKLQVLRHRVISDWLAVNHPIKLMGLIVAFKYLGIGLIDPFYALYLASFTGSYTAVGGWISLMGFTALLALVPLMRLADHIKNKMVVQHGLNLYSIAMIFYFVAGLYQNKTTLFIAVVAHGLGIAMVDGGAEVYIRKHSTFHNTARTFGYLNSIKYLGWVIGMFVGGIFFHYYGLKGIFLFAIPFFLINSIFFSSIPEKGMNSLMSGLHRYFSHAKDMLRIVKDLHRLGDGMFFNYLISFFDGWIMILSFSFMPLFARTLNLGYQEIAFLMGIMYVPYLFSFIFAEIADRFNGIDLVVIGLSLAVATFSLLFFAKSIFAIAVLASLISFSMAMIRPAYNGLISHMAPKGMLGEVSSVQNFIIRGAVMTCPILFGVISDSLSIRWVFIFTALTGMVMIGMALTLKSVAFFKQEFDFKRMMRRLI